MSELTQILSDIEVVVRDLSEELVADLGVRDELEFEKVHRQTTVTDSYLSTSRIIINPF